MNMHNLIIYVITINIMVAVLSSLGMFAADPRMLEDTDYESHLATGDNLEETTGTEMGWGTIILSAKRVLISFAKIVYAIPYLVAMSFGTAGVMGIVVAGLVTIFTFMYGWLALEIIRGMKV